MTGARTRTQSGFTLVEVMIAIGIMTVGSLGILAMHNAVSAANRTANEMNTALTITERWMERIDRDALSWTEQGISSSSLSSTDYLSELAGSAADTDWFTPSPSNSDESYAFDYFGQDDTDGSATKYCVNLRLSWLRQGSTARVDIRTFWFREGYVHGGPKHSKWVSGSAFRGADCDAATVDAWDVGVAPDPAPNVNVIFASTVVRWLRKE
jgi:prepilin-type N-terminal cleavage/methylation domain-containing protein